MISFWVNAAGSFGMEEYIARRLPGLGERLQIRTYESLAPENELFTGPHVFASLCQLPPSGHALVASLSSRLRQAVPSVRLLNDPHRSAGRFELLTRLHAAGINRFRAWRASEADSVDRFPVFVRQDSGHEGALTRLLRDRRELAVALRSLRVRGLRLDDLLVVEFCDLADGDGIVRMASVYKVGEHVVPAFLLRSRQWMLKWNLSDQDAPAMQEFLCYVSDNPHEAWVRRIFALAGIDYGRLDYGICGDTLQVWEINLNPTPGPPPGPEPPPLEPPLEEMLQEGRRIYNRAMWNAFTALDPCGESGTVPIRLDPALIDGMQRDLKRVRRRGATLGVLRDIYRNRLIGWPIRAAYSLLLPRR